MNFQSRPRILLLSGLPATRKSTLGRRLAADLGFLHLDVEKPGELETHGLRMAWNSLFSHGPQRLLDSLSRPTVIDWGFPSHCLPYVESLVRAGVEPWWLGGDEEAARQAFIARGTGSLDEFKEQVDAIRANWPAIEQVFSPNILVVISTGPTYVDPAVLAERMLGDR